MQALAARLLERGHTSMLVWVAAKNPATHFYASLGGQPVASRTEPFGGVDVEELAYGYDDLRTLVSAHGA